MALLVLLLPALQRADAAPPADTAPLSWLLSADGLVITRQGDSPLADCPRADTVVAVLPAASVAWHRPVVPKAPANRLRAALAGVMEDQLLADDDQVHLALPPSHTPGQPCWVAVIDKPALQAQLARLAAAGLVVDRLVPALAPALLGSARGDSRYGSSLQDSAQLSSQQLSLQSSAQSSVQGSQASVGPTDSVFSSTLGAEPDAHFFTQRNAAGLLTPWLAFSDADHALCLPLAGGLARGLQTRWLERGALFSATPAAAAVAEQWLGAPVAVRSVAEQALAAVRSPWNLLQFELAPQHRSSLALGKLGRQFMSPAWAQVRLGVLALVVLQVLGLNVMAWQQQHSLDTQRAAMDALLRSTHPQVRAVLDAPAQMQRETAALRVAAGVPADEDFEPMLATAAAAWPDGQPAAAQLRFEPGKLSLAAAGWQPAQVAQLRSRLQPAGWSVDNTDGRLQIQRSAPKVAP